MTKSKQEWIDEFNEKFGKAYVSDKEGGHFIGSYLIEFIEKLLKEERQRVVEMIEGSKKDIAWLAGKEYRNSVQVIDDVLEKISDLQSKLEEK